jgi:hypothetical protein
MGQHIKRSYDSVRREVLCNFSIGFGVPMRLVRLIKTHLNKTYSRVRIGRHLTIIFSPECSITIVFQLHCKLHH